jgi:ABC-type phosphate/phosphonate transport system permease subunit
MLQFFVLALVAVAVSVPVAVPIDAFLADKATKQQLKQALPKLEITPQWASASANRSR